MILLQGMMAAPFFFALLFPVGIGLTYFVLLLLQTVVAFFDGYHRRPARTILWAKRVVWLGLLMGLMLCALSVYILETTRPLFN